VQRNYCAFAAVVGLALGGISGAEATVILFSSPDAFTGNETLIEFDELGVPPSSPIESGKGVTFSLLEQNTLIDTGFAPTAASAPNTTYAREFPPRDGPIFLNTINFNALETDLQIDFGQQVRRVAAEIRSGQTLNEVDDLTFELYLRDILIADLTIPIRGQDDFFFYGLESMTDFDRWVIRQRPDERFDLENLRFEVPEPGMLFILGGGLLLLVIWRQRSFYQKTH
jgi:hypothetical protein